MKTRKKSLIFPALLFVLGIFLGWIVKPTNPQTNAPAEHSHAVDEVWTCSMHPRIRQPEPGKCPICGMDLIPAASAAPTGSANPFVHEMSPEAVALANVHTTRVEGASGKGSLFLTGKVQADERNTARLTAKFPGRIEALHVNFTGQTVRKGEKLATVYSPELITAQRELLEALAAKETFPELYQAAREKLRRWKIDPADIHRIETSGQPVESFEVRADEGGVVTDKMVSVGDYVDTGDPLFQVVDLDPIWVELDAYENQLSRVSVGDRVQFGVEAFPSEVFDAEITFIDPRIDPESRTTRLRAEGANPDGLLMPEMLVTAEVQTGSGEPDHAVVIPRTALLWTGKRALVYVAVPHSPTPKFEMREITTGPLMGEVYLVESGLEIGEEVVTNGVFAVDASAQLAGNYSMMNPPQRTSFEVHPAFREDLNAVYEAYFQVKNALVDDDPGEAAAHVETLYATLHAVDAGVLEADAAVAWDGIGLRMAKALDAMRQGQDLEALRRQFEVLSLAVLESADSFGVGPDKAYKSYCPMAFGDRGAYWLSETEEIRNPYFGAAMLACGEVAQVFAKTD